VAITADAVVIGGGVIGTAVAWRAALAGLSVVVADPGEGDAASLVAAGMLAPVTESWFGEEALLRLSLLALHRFPGFVSELERAVGLPAGLRQEGTLAVAYDAGDQAALARLTAFRRAAGLAAEELDGPACRELEPFLAPGVRGGVLCPGDWSVDNRRYLAALRAACETAGVRLVPGRAVAVVPGSGGWQVRLAGAGDAPAGAGDAREGTGATLEGTAVVVAAGCWSGQIAGLPGPLGAAFRPVKGQLLRLRLPPGMPPVLTRTVRAVVRGFDVYLVPRADGEIVAGATSEERGFDRSVTAGAVHRLLDDAISVLPVAGELVLAETCAGLRPGTPDNGPVVGAAGPGLLVAAGHYRNGILLSAVTADAVTALLTGEQPAPQWREFSPQRFGAGVTGSGAAR
jgi:glycine oxidase